MRAVVQRVRQASVLVGEEVVGAIGPGLLAYVGLGKGDGPIDETWVLEKIFNLRILEDQGTDRSLLDIGGGLLFVSQFTLYGSLLRGRRPSFDEAMPVEEARSAFEHFMKSARAFPTGAPKIEIASGRFQAEMQVTSVNDGPFTLCLESPRPPKGAP